MKCKEKVHKCGWTDSTPCGSRCTKEEHAQCPGVSDVDLLRARLKSGRENESDTVALIGRIVLDLAAGVLCNRDVVLLEDYSPGFRCVKPEEET